MDYELEREEAIFFSEREEPMKSEGRDNSFQEINGLLTRKRGRYSLSGRE
jgi:hypothetical protein